MKKFKFDISQSKDKIDRTVTVPIFEYTAKMCYRLLYAGVIY